jgi:hypothetical protein
MQDWRFLEKFLLSFFSFFFSHAIKSIFPISLTFDSVTVILVVVGWGAVESSIVVLSYYGAWGWGYEEYYGLWRKENFERLNVWLPWGFDILNGKWYFGRAKLQEKKMTFFFFFFFILLLFFFMNYQKIRNTPWIINSTKIKHSTTKDNHFSSFRQSKRLKQTVNGSCAVLYGGMLEDDGSSWRKKGRWW